MQEIQEIQERGERRFGRRLTPPRPGQEMQEIQEIQERGERRFARRLTPPTTCSGDAGDSGDTGARRTPLWTAANAAHDATGDAGDSGDTGARRTPLCTTADAAMAHHGPAGDTGAPLRGDGWSIRKAARRETEGGGRGQRRSRRATDGARSGSRLTVIRKMWGVGRSPSPKAKPPSFQTSKLPIGLTLGGACVTLAFVYC